MAVGYAGGGTVGAQDGSVQPGADINKRAALLAGLRKRYDAMIAMAQGALAHRDENAAVRFAQRAHDMVPDGKSLILHVQPDGNVLAIVHDPRGGEQSRHVMTPDQFHHYLIGPATSFDHVIDNGVGHNLGIASGRPTPRVPEHPADPIHKVRQVLQHTRKMFGVDRIGQAPPRIGYAAGGEVYTDEQGRTSPADVRDTLFDEQGNLIFAGDARQYAAGGPVRGYDDGGEVDDTLPPDPPWTSQDERDNPPPPDVPADNSIDDYMLNAQRGAASAPAQQPVQEPVSGETDIGTLLSRSGSKLYSGMDERIRAEQAAKAAVLPRAWGSVKQALADYINGANAAPPAQVEQALNEAANRDPAGDTPKHVQDAIVNEAPAGPTPIDPTGYMPEKPPAGSGTSGIAATNPQKAADALSEPPNWMEHAGYAPVQTGYGGPQQRQANDPNSPEAYAARHYGNDPARRDAFLAYGFWSRTQPEYDKLVANEAAHKLTPESAARLDELTKQRDEAVAHYSHRWGTFDGNTLKNALTAPGQPIAPPKYLTDTPKLNVNFGGRIDPSYVAGQRVYGPYDPDRPGTPTTGANGQQGQQGQGRTGYGAPLPRQPSKEDLRPVGRNINGVPVNRNGEIIKPDGTLEFTPPNQSQRTVIDPRTGERLEMTGGTGIPTRPREGTPGGTGVRGSLNRPFGFSAKDQAYQNLSASGALDIVPSDKYGRSPEQQAAEGSRPWTQDMSRPIGRPMPRGAPPMYVTERPAPYYDPNTGQVVTPPQQVMPGSGAPVGVAPGSPEAGRPPAWQPPPNIPGAVGQQPPADDQSPAARAARAFPMASQTRQRVQYQGTLERQAQEDQLKRESYATRDTPESRMARAKLADDGKTFRSLAKDQQTQYHTDMQGVIADNNRFERAYEAVQRNVGGAAAELLKDYRAKTMNDPNYKPNDDELGAMVHAHDLIFGSQGAAPPAQVPKPVAPLPQGGVAPATPAQQSPQSVLRVPQPAQNLVPAPQLRQPAPAAIQALKADPRRRAEFDNYYGPGASARYLGQ
jgi:hypothetical protein